MSDTISGSWTYRSYRNDPELVGGDADRAVGNIFGEGIFDLLRTGNEVAGTLDMGGGYVLDVTGSVEGTDAAPTLALALAGVGRAATPTAGWEYDYRAVPAFTWPEGIRQVPALVGSVIRAKPHGGSPAGYVASFIAVRRP